MPLKAAVEEHLKKTVTNADEYKRAAELYEKYPSLQEAFLADADYQRQVQATATARKAAETAEASAKEREAKNLKWWNDTSGTLAGLETENATLKTKLTDLEAGRGAADDRGATDAQLKKWDAAIAEIRTKLDENDKVVSQFRGTDGKPKQLVDVEQLNRSADGFGQFMMDSVDILLEHQKKYGETLKSRDLYKYMTDNKIDAVDKAYEAMTQKKRQENWEAQRTEELRKELLTKMKMPIDTGSSTAQADGPLKLFINKQQPTPDIPADGSGRLAAAAAAEMRSEGKA